MAANLLSQRVIETTENGFVQYNVIQIYQVITSARTVGPMAVLATAGIPLRNTVVSIDGVLVWCKTREPTQPDSANAATRWEVVCTFTNATSQFERDENGFPVSDPVEIVKSVSITYQEYQEPVTDARLRSITVGPEYDGGAARPTPPWMSKTARGVITNSAGEPRYVERPAFRKIITVTRYANNWENAWDRYLGAINRDEVTIIQKDSRGNRLIQTFEPLSLLMMDIVKEDVWKDSRLYFRPSFVMAYNKNTWIHSELDVGTKRRIFENQYKLDGTQYSGAELAAAPYLIPAGKHKLIEITEKTPGGAESTLGEPVKFNGYGCEMPTPASSTYDEKESIYLNYDKFLRLTFATLDL